MKRANKTAMPVVGADGSFEVAYAQAAQAVATVTPAVLEQFLTKERAACFAFEYRITLAKAVGDMARAETLAKDGRYLKAKARRAHFEKQIASQFPQHVVKLFGTKVAERMIVVAEYLDALARKRDAGIENAASLALDEPSTEREMVRQKMQLALRYEKYLKLKYDRYIKQLEVEANA